MGVFFLPPVSTDIPNKAFKVQSNSQRNRLQHHFTWPIASLPSHRRWWVIWFAWETLHTFSYATAFWRGQSLCSSTHCNSASQVGDEAYGVKLSLRRLAGGTWGTWVRWLGGPILDCLPGRLNGGRFPADSPKLLWVMLGSIRRPVVTAFLTFYPGQSLSAPKSPNPDTVNAW